MTGTNDPSRLNIESCVTIIPIVSIADPRTDQQLVAALNAGDGSAFDVLYYRHRDWVHRLAWRFTADAEAALDVLQETFAYFHRKFPGFRLTARLTTFFYPVVRNLALAERRKRSRFIGPESAIELTAPPANPQQPADLSIALRDLPEAHRETLLMRFVDDMTLEEISSALQIPLGTVKSRIHNALTSLRQSPAAKEYFLDE